MSNVTQTASALELEAVPEFPESFGDPPSEFARQTAAFVASVRDFARADRVRYAVTVRRGRVRAAFVANGPGVADVLKVLLPRGYRGAVRGAEAEPPGGYVVEVVRRLDVIDLPDELGPLPLAAAVARARRTATARRVIAQRRRSWSTGCVPVVAPLDRRREPPRPEPADWLRVACGCAWARVEVSAGPVRDADRTLAAEVYDALIAPPPAPDEAADGTNGSDPGQSRRRTPRADWGSRRARTTVEGKGVQATRERLRRPASALREVTVRVTAATPGEAAAVAASWAEEHGGMAAYSLSMPCPTGSLSDLPLAPELPAQLADRADELGLGDPNGPRAGDVCRVVRRLERVYSETEVVRLFRLPVGPVRGLTSAPVIPFVKCLPVAPPLDPTRALLLGLLATPETLPCSFREAFITNPRLAGADVVALATSALAGHLAILGHVGFGKSWLFQQIMTQAIRQGKRVHVIDTTTAEHHAAFGRCDPPLDPAVRRFALSYPHRPGWNSDVLRVDICRVPTGVPVQWFISNRLPAFAAIMNAHLTTLPAFIDGFRQYMLGDTVLGCRSRCGFEQSTPGGPSRVHVDADGRVWPGLRTFVTFLLDEFLPNNVGGGQEASKRDWQDYFRVRLNQLLHGPVGRMAKEADHFTAERFGPGNPTGDDSDPTDCALYDPFTEVLGHSGVIELELLAEEEKAGLMQFLVVFMQEHLWAERERLKVDKLPFNRVLCIEEAHKLVGTSGDGSRGEVGGEDPRARVARQIADAMGEFRKLGLGVCYSTVSPSRLSLDVLELVDTIIAFRTPALRNRRLLGRTMGCTPAEIAYLAHLNHGNAVIKAHGFPRPVPFIVPADDVSQWLQERA